MMALSICQKRLQVNSEEIFSNKELQGNAVNFQPITYDIHAAFCDFKAPGNFQSYPSFRKL
jgi:hypothetical protein